MLQIGPKTIERIKSMLAEQLDTYATKIDHAYIKAEGDKLKVSLSVDLFPSGVKQGGIDVDVTLSFTADKVKEKLSDTVVEKQEELPLTDKVYKMGV